MFTDFLGGTIFFCWDDVISKEFPTEKWGRQFFLETSHCAKVLVGKLKAGDDMNMMDFPTVDGKKSGVYQLIW